ncbi:MAG TPA: type II toxin-antitoxin system VapC family toxin [Candidatus Sulfomarinibacteraceae bacterium]|nr:type II toxin-antitoxin system VapC family toxin [Candidatus Sulfomarinibacteraceae bacterium]
MPVPLVIDASAAVHLATVAGPIPGLDDYRLIAPGLLWSECLSAIRKASWRGAMPDDASVLALERLEALPIERADGPDHRARAFALARDLGWARTYDAEYVALARHLGAALLSTDLRLRRGVATIIRTLGPSDL